MGKIVKRQLEMTSVTSNEMDGIEMGVLADGTSFLTGRGLAAVCGVVPSVINQWASEYTADSKKPRDVAITGLIEKQNYQGDVLFIKTKIGSQEVNAYPEAVCMAVLEYYAFDAERKNERALRNYRALARAGLRAFIYSSLGYSPGKQIPEAFRSYYDRLLLNKLPPDVYSCFAETSHIVLTSIQAGLVVDQHTVPDISVGQAWSAYWKEHNLEAQYGPRSKYPHNFPPDYPQSAVTPEAFTYPLGSLGVFRGWLNTEYLPKKYPAYIDRKVRLGALPASRAELLIETLTPKQLGDGDD